VSPATFSTGFPQGPLDPVSRETARATERRPTSCGRWVPWSARGLEPRMGQHAGITFSVEHATSRRDLLARERWPRWSPLAPSSRGAGWNRCSVALRRPDPSKRTTAPGVGIRLLPMCLELRAPVEASSCFTWNIMARWSTTPPSCLRWDRDDLSRRPGGWARRRVPGGSGHLRRGPLDLSSCGGSWRGVRALSRKGRRASPLSGRAAGATACFRPPQVFHVKQAAGHGRCAGAQPASQQTTTPCRRRDVLHVVLLRGLQVLRDAVEERLRGPRCESPLPSKRSASRPSFAAATR
jgi:hypothetical protein